MISLMKIGMATYILVLAEHAIYIFQRPICCLRVEEVDNRDEGEVEESPDDVKFPFEVLNTDRSDLHN